MIGKLQIYLGAAMQDIIFARAMPSKIEIKETYRYRSSISGNPTTDEDGRPEGSIRVEVPYEGYKFFTRDAYKDVLNQKTHSSAWSLIKNSQLFTSIVKKQTNADPGKVRIGYLSLTGISPEALWPDITQYSLYQGFHLDITGNTQVKDFIDDKTIIIFSHEYQPDRPKTEPRPYPLSLKVDILDERTVFDMYGDQLETDEWDRFTQELSFERSLVFLFDLEMALPKVDKIRNPPVLKHLHLTWPTNTSYHNLTLLIQPEPGIPNWGQWPEQNIFYNPFEPGTIEWRKVQFYIAPNLGALHSEIMIWKAPKMLLFVEDPGEFYDQKSLPFALEVILPDTLLSGGRPQYYNAQGEEVHQSKLINAYTSVQLSGDINLQQRFNRRILSPHQQLQFEGVLTEMIRVRDIEILLHDKGFQVKDEKKLGEDKAPKYSLRATRKEGPDEISFLILVQGVLDKTERERTIPGGQKYKSSLQRGSTVIDMRAELRGDIKKLAQIMNEVHRELKERFQHVITLE